MLGLVLRRLAGAITDDLHHRHRRLLHDPRGGPAARFEPRTADRSVDHCRTSMRPSTWTSRSGSNTCSISATVLQGDFGPSFTRRDFTVARPVSGLVLPVPRCNYGRAGACCSRSSVGASLGVIPALRQNSDRGLRRRPHRDLRHHHGLSQIFVVAAESVALIVRRPGMRAGCPPAAGARPRTWCCRW